MNNLVISIVALVVLSDFAGGQTSELNPKLPTLHQIKEITLAPSYSCRSSEEFSKGYASTALFLSDFGGPDLVFNGGCGAADYFQAATAGDDMSLVADLGTGISLEELSAHRAFNVEGVHSFEAYSKFAREVKVEPDHTYGVLLNATNRRGLLVFTVTEYVRNKKVSLRYAVESYQVMLGRQVASPGFEWERGNSRN
jgi:hypothetical protein